jgi:hypothetical protein
LKVKVQINEAGIRPVSLEGLVIAARWVSRNDPQIFFGEIGEQKVLFVVIWRTDSVIFQGEQIIFTTALETFFLPVEDFRKFVIYTPQTRKAEYKDDPQDFSPAAIIIPVIKVFSWRDIRVLRAIAKFLKKK